MQQAHVYSRGILAGVLSKDSTGYHFQYLSDYLAQDSREYPPISLNFPKQKSAFKSNFLFPFFYGLLAEGEEKALQCRSLRIDDKDHFARLLKTCEAETTSGVTVKEIP
ncbi:HipA N-terminal domain-containing protein [Telmatocola sphagniphila]|uniref:HipA N-terminal domain-containing protein n=1 Tax=Telmatocola sphagniphila TaxID=1123043 RepID=A0A8E6B8Y4_9BACT|nr:HipA N-terminal domain-containing protein [Telmatocola sphagniphila]QVL34350.1 HipA N-terminal domain-containing protein [Telmatocola sphagniphila]